MNRIALSGFCLCFIVCITIFSTRVSHAANDYIVAPSGGDITGKQLSDKLAKGDVTLESSRGGTAGAGDVIINDIVTWTANNKLTLTASNNVKINTSIHANGNSAGVVINHKTKNGGEPANVNGTYQLNGASITLSGDAPTITIAGEVYTVINALGKAGDETKNPPVMTLQGMGATGNLAKKFALGSNIDASATSGWNSGTGFAPIGIDKASAFTGNFEGLSHVISNLKIDESNEPRAGMFGFTGSGSNINNVGLVGGSIKGTEVVGGLIGRNTGRVNNCYINADVSGNLSKTNVATEQSIGGLVGRNFGEIVNSYSTGVVTGNSTNELSNVGGLAGYNYKGISNSYATGNVTGGANNNIGGLVGRNVSGQNGNIRASYAIGTVAGRGNKVGGLVGSNAGTISYSNAVGKVNIGQADADAGGLVGSNETGGNISNTYATGGVSGNGSNAGGLVGSNKTGAIIADSYATGDVIGSTAVGELVGNNNGTITDSYWNLGLSQTGVGQGAAAGATGLTADQMLVSSNFMNFTFTATPGAAGWVVVNTDGSLQTAASSTAAATTPMLASEYSTTIYDGHQLQLMIMKLDADFTLGGDVDATGTSGRDVWTGSKFVPVGNLTNKFTGSFDGAGHNISNLNVKGTDNVGLFGYTDTTAVIEDVGLVSGVVTGVNTVGTLVGLNSGNISGSYAENTNVTGMGSSVSGSGGLVGNNAGTIVGSYATGVVTGMEDVGGLVGINQKNISSSYAFVNMNDAISKAGGLVGTNNSTATITTSYAGGTVAGSGNIAGGLVGSNAGTVSYSNAVGIVDIGQGGTNAGGLVGSNEAGGSISNTYATGGVKGEGGNAGGLVGSNKTGATIADSYATGDVSGSTAVGELVGNNSGTITNSYWNLELGQTGVGEGSVGGAQGLTAEKMLVSSNFNNFTFTATPGAAGWVVVNANGSLQTAASDVAAATSPMLASEYSTTIYDGHQLQLMVMALGADYELSNDIDLSATSNGSDVWGGITQPAPSGFIPVGKTNTTAFTGNFNGKGYAIKKLNISRTDNYVGLFGYASGSNISNVAIVNYLDVNNPDVKEKVMGDNYVGALVGYADSNSSISYSYTDNFVAGYQTYVRQRGDDIGGLVGYNGGTVRNSASSGIAYGGNYVGGLVGYNAGTINNSYSKTNTNARVGRVQTGGGTGGSGGLAGYSTGTVSNSYAMGNVIKRGSVPPGGLVGCVKYYKDNGNCVLSGSVNRGYWDIDTSGTTKSNRGHGLSDAQMKQQNSYSGWDFNSTWDMKTYPALRNMPTAYTP